ncbi:aromatic ring-hydroxylating oxygenase subunit alpha [Novosphingobium lentum]|uniref:aromatic ring-hydroxylating oxygenase subunit alpha n=1 Tax=Novosphingobium lentum TaxID=145287 RepID=UPI00082FE281|nr:aromatic ring-hydroxylating dioxygenase subunit alpha [Novosphingobium lentum]
MRTDTLDRLNTTMEAQLVRDDHPAGFPYLPPVPSSRYTDPGFAKLEHDELLMKNWLLAGHVSELPAAGSYFLFEQLDQSVIISRAKDGVIRAFHNSCRHRGSALLLEHSGKAMRFVCPYHSWGYSLEGELKSVPDQHDFTCFEKADHGLKPVRCEIERGMIFINFDENAGSLADFMAPQAPQKVGYPIEKMVVKKRLLVEMNCNWKLALHNFLEIYHVATVHAKTLAPHLNSQSFVIALFENGHMRFGTRKKKGESLFQPSLFKPDDIADVFRECTIALPTFPNTFYSLDPIGFSLQSFWPAGVDKSIMEVRLMGWDVDSDEDRAHWDAMDGIVRNILSEDLCLFRSIQQSLTRGTIPQLTFGYQERALYWFEEEVDRRIGAHNIPESQRVAPVLAEQMER